MDFDTSTWMMIAFVVSMIGGIWKVYTFMPSETLKDDDTGEDTHNALVDIMYKVLKELDSAPDSKTLHEKMTQHKEFDKEKFWRFNQNKLNQLLNKHYVKNKHLSSIEDVHKEAKTKNQE